MSSPQAGQMISHWPVQPPWVIPLTIRTGRRRRHALLPPWPGSPGLILVMPVIVRHDPMNNTDSCQKITARVRDPPNRPSRSARGWHRCRVAGTRSRRLGAITRHSAAAGRAGLALGGGPYFEARGAGAPEDLSRQTGPFLTTDCLNGSAATRPAMKYACTATLRGLLNAGVCGVRLAPASGQLRSEARQDADAT